jgi:hypothetical protein
LATDILVVLVKLAVTRYNRAVAAVPVLLVKTDTIQERPKAGIDVTAYTIILEQVLI